MQHSSGRDSVRFDHLRADQLRAAAARDAIVILPVAATEQHGPHLPVMVDRLLAVEIAERAALRLQDTEEALVAPCVWHGLSDHHMPFGGTFTLDFPTFLAVLSCLCRSLTRHGFRRIALLNSHGGNEAALKVTVDELARDLDAPIVTFGYARLAAGAIRAVLEEEDIVRHASEAETSMMLALRPDLVRRDLLGVSLGQTRPTAMETVSPDLHRWYSFDERTQTGAIAPARLATAEKGERLLEAAAEAVALCLANPAVWSSAEAFPILGAADGEGGP